jgi:hypothetical protein
MRKMRGPSEVVTAWPPSTERSGENLAREVQADAAESAIGTRLARVETHELGNLLVSMQFCVQRLRGHQRTAEFEELVGRMLDLSEQSIDATRRLIRALRLLPLQPTKPRITSAENWRSAK